MSDEDFIRQMREIKEGVSGYGGSAKTDEQKLAEWDEATKDTDYKLVKRSRDKFWKLFAIASFIALFIFGWAFLNNINIGNLKSTIENNIEPIFNPNVYTNNSYEFSTPIENEYQNNFTIVNNINCPTTP